MKRLTAILSLLVLCLLPFVSPYFFGKGMRFSSNHQKNPIRFEVCRHPKVHHAVDRDGSEQKLNAFNHRCERFFNQLTLAPEAFYAVARFLGFTVFILLLEPLLALLMTLKKVLQPKKAQSHTPQKHQIAPYKWHLLD